MSDALRLIHGDCLDAMRSMPAKSVDLVFGSPPYEAARTLGIGFNLRGHDYVDWCVERYVECLRVCKGLVAWVVEGQTRQFRYSAVPSLLMADLHRRGVHLRKPPIFHRVGIPGSGGPDFLRNDYEFIVCAGPGGKLPWSDNTAMGHPPKWRAGGMQSHRLPNGTRVNDPWGKRGRGNSLAGRERDGTKRLGNGIVTPSGSARTNEAKGNGSYDPPVKSNPGNKIQKLYTVEDVLTLMHKLVCEPSNVGSYIVGGGVMGSRLCHENEAPFPESLAEFYIRSFCPPGGIVLDPFCGSGTTLAVAERCGRQWIGIDVRESQVDLSRRRVAEVTGSCAAGGKSC